MSDQSAIEWTDATWNPVRGCSRVSEGCRNCYAERTAIRQVGAAYRGLVKSTSSGPRWTGKVAFVEGLLTQPLRWKEPRRVFVNSMSDLFHEGVTNAERDQIFAVMAQARRHTFQILTKRPETMLGYCEEMGTLNPKDRARRVVASMYRDHPAEYLVRGGPPDERCGDFPWPLPNVHLGVSVEDQATADARIPLLLQTPADVRWVSYEPALGPVDFGGDTEIGYLSWLKRHNIMDDRLTARVDWVVVGGESGPGARPFDLAWARSTVAQCRATGTPAFVKQLGAVPMIDEADWRRDARALLSARNRDRVPKDFVPLAFNDSKGGDWTEWPADLRVREFPTFAREAHA